MSEAAVPHGKFRDIATNLFYTTAFIKTDAGNGTCFFVCRDERAQYRGAWVVTNKHVLGHCNTATFSLHRKDCVALQIFTTSRSSWIDHPDDVDLSILSLALLAETTGVDLDVLDFAMLPLTSVPDLKYLEANCAGIEEVTLIGYPYGVYDDVNYIPVARRGTTAMPSWIDWKGRPEFLVDIAGHPGNSGGPLLLFNHGNYTNKIGTLMAGQSRLHLLGIFSQVYVGHANSSLNLGVCIRGSVINDMIARLQIEQG